MRNLINYKIVFSILAFFILILLSGCNKRKVNPIPLPPTAPTTSVDMVKNGVAQLPILTDNATLPLDNPLNANTGMPVGTNNYDENISGASERRLAVNNLTSYINQISGATLNVELAAEGKVGIYVGRVSDFPWLNQDLSDLGVEGFVVKNDNKNIYLLGKTSLGVKMAVVSFLTELGCRWFFAGDTWKDIPQKSTISVKMNLRQTPSYDLVRSMSYGYSIKDKPKTDYINWYYFNKLGGPTPLNSGHYTYDIKIDSAVAAQSEIIAMVKGVRGFANPVSATNFCFSNPVMVQQMTNFALKRASAGITSISMSPPDGDGFCECTRCQAMAGVNNFVRENYSVWGTRPDGLKVCIVSETYFKAINEVAKAVKLNYPNAFIGTNAYSSFSHPPTFAMEDNVIVAVATQFRRTPLTLDQQVREWGRLSRNVGTRDYWSVFQWDFDMPILGTFNPSSIKENLNNYRNNNVRGLNAEASNNWGSRGISYYIAAKLLWDVNADVKLLIKDFYDRSFGAASSAMEKYYVELFGTNSLAVSPAYLNYTSPYPQTLNNFISKDVLKAGFKNLDAALVLVAPNSKEADRINQLRMYLYYILLKEKVLLAIDPKSTATNQTKIDAIKNMTVYGMRLFNTNMIHSYALGGSGFNYLWDTPTKALLATIPESQTAYSGWRAIGTPPTKAELDVLWNEGKAYLGI